MQTLPDAKDWEVDGGTVVQAIEAQHGVLIERAHRIHSFSHLTFQEFFTTKYITEHYSEKQLRQMMQHLLEKRWHEIFIMTASLLPNADSFFANFRQHIKAYLLQTPELKKLGNLYLPEMLSVNCAQRILIFDLALQRNLNIQQDVEGALEIVANIQNLVDTEDLKRVPIKASNHRYLVQTLYDKFAAPKGFVEYLKIPIRNLQILLLQLFVVPDHAAVKSCLQIIDNHLKSSAKRFLEISYIGNSDSLYYSSLEKERLDQLTKTVSHSLNIVKENLELIDRTVGIKLSSLPPHWPIMALSREEVENFIYLNTLLIECVNVAAVSNRKKFY